MPVLLVYPVAEALMDLGVSSATMDRVVFPVLTELLALAVFPVP
jgi:hypothetical protein